MLPTTTAMFYSATVTTPIVAPPTPYASGRSRSLYASSAGIRDLDRASVFDACVTAMSRRPHGSSPYALRPVVASTLLRMPLPEPPAACFARLPSLHPALTATQSPWRLPSASSAHVDSPFAHTSDLLLPPRVAVLVLTPDTARCLSCPVCVRVRSLARFEPLGASGPLEKAVALRYTAV